MIYFFGCIATYMGEPFEETQADQKQNQKSEKDMSAQRQA
jgi:hypothetical protein